MESSSVECESSSEDSDAEPASDILQPVKYYVLDEADSLADVKAHPGEARLKPLARIPTCAIFHKLTTGRGVPHSFIRTPFATHSWSVVAEAWS